VTIWGIIIFHLVCMCYKKFNLPYWQESVQQQHPRVIFKWKIKHIIWILFCHWLCSSLWQTKISYLPWMYGAVTDIRSRYMYLTHKGSCISTSTWIMTSAWTGHGHLLSLWRTQQVCSTNSKIWCSAWPTGTSKHSPHQGLLFLPLYPANTYSVLVFIYFYFYIYTL